jgi:hypothetical protein
LAFYTIHATPGLPERDRRRAARAGPRAAGLRRSHRSLLKSAGFVSVEEIDVTAEYRVTTSDWVEQKQRFAHELRETEGDEAFEKRMAERKEALAAIEEGLLQRSFLVAERPG